MKAVGRRDFLKGAGAITAAGTLLPRTTLAAKSAQSKAAQVIVVHGADTVDMLQAGIERMGGWSALVKNGQQVTIKPNVAWASKPEQGANTDPELVGKCVEDCYTAGANQVVVPENTCSSHEVSFKMSGIGAVVKKAGGKIYRPMEADHFRAVDLPRAISLKRAEVAIDVLETGCLINMPVAKSHGSAILTISMKNWMGSVKDRGFWHRNDLHQCIADFSTFIRPDLIIVDATRIMLTKGPRGPGELAYPGELIFSRDPVAADAYTATLFKMNPFDVPYIRKAHDMNVGCGDLAGIEVVRIEA